MHLVTILAYACLFWRAAGPNTSPPSDLIDHAWLTWLVVLTQPAILGLAAWGVARRTVRHLPRADRVVSAQQFYHRSLVALRTALLAGFALSVLGTPWPRWFAFEAVTPELRILGDLIVLAPFFAGAIAIWLATAPVERMLYELGRAVPGTDRATDRPWSTAAYLDFNVRHHLLVVAVPMTIILFAANVAGGYESSLQAWTGWYWTPDVSVGGVAAVVYVLAPLMLTRIWRTSPLEPGPLRDRLEALCERIGLRVRDILIWRSDGTMVNAAVMGVWSPVRYVLLSDVLLAEMTPRQVEAVFGHEAGHVRHRHIPHFLLFAFVGWIGAAGVMEVFLRFVASPELDPAQWLGTIQLAGVAAMLVFWGLGFGWLSRRFERQADLFAARCAAATADGCTYPCSVHPDATTTLPQDGRVCSTGATVFASALEQVAVLNGIPREEPSWRHASIGSRIRFLLSLAADPARTRRFDRSIRRIKTALIATALVGSAAAAMYWWNVPHSVLTQTRPTIAEPRRQLAG